MTDELNVVALVKGCERYFFWYDDAAESWDALLQSFGRLAADKDSSFTWHDAAVLSQKAHRRRLELPIADRPPIGGQISSET